jgi:hypothetical protein
MLGKPTAPTLPCPSPGLARAVDEFIVDVRLGSGGAESLLKPSRLPASAEDGLVLVAPDVAVRCAGFLATGGAGLLALSCCDSCDTCDAAELGRKGTCKPRVGTLLKLPGCLVDADIPCRLGGGGGGATEFPDSLPEPRFMRPTLAGSVVASRGGGRFLGVVMDADDVFIDLGSEIFS